MDIMNDRNMRAFAARAEADKAGRDPVKLGEWLVEMTERARKTEAHAAALEAEVAGVRERAENALRERDQAIAQVGIEARGRGRAEAEIDRLQKALVDAASWFEEYAYLHEQKGTPDGDAKAKINQARARLLRAALAEK